MRKLMAFMVVLMAVVCVQAQLTETVYTAHGKWYNESFDAWWDATLDIEVDRKKDLTLKITSVVEGEIVFPNNRLDELVALAQKTQKWEEQAKASGDEFQKTLADYGNIGFQFISDGEDCYVGIMIMNGLFEPQIILTAEEFGKLDYWFGEGWQIAHQQLMQKKSVADKYK